jgi:arabinogalactan endo-1,4-beta-galactosidase
MATTYHKEIVLSEVSYPWKPYAKQPAAAPFPQTPEGQKEWLKELNRIVQETPGNLGGGLFWWEPVVPANKPLRDRGYFDDDGNVLPVITVFDAYTRK